MGSKPEVFDMMRYREQSVCKEHGEWVLACSNPGVHTQLPGGNDT